MFLCHLLVDKPQRCSWEHTGGIGFGLKLQKKFKVAAFSPLVFKSNMFEKIKYAQKKEILRNFQYKKVHADPLRRFLNF